MLLQQQQQQQQHVGATVLPVPSSGGAPENPTYLAGFEAGMLQGLAYVQRQQRLQARLQVGLASQQQGLLAGAVLAGGYPGGGMSGVTK
jgi:hypothetical protein